MVDDKYIGLALALASSLAIGTSFIITKKVYRLLRSALLCSQLVPHRDLMMLQNAVLHMGPYQTVFRICVTQYGGRAYQHVSSMLRSA